ncbi:hypothetical protein EDD86DRAFT_127820 [Gorgonomyces haynaldii]|nr:hypothetical protein EDD86DRAFT_127820 [Gorgonomyces haynaldii]
MQPPDHFEDTLFGIANEESTDNEQKERNSLSRHVASVISHFTGNEEGYQRLLSELDDFIHVVSPTGNILYSGNAVLGYAPKSLVGSDVLSLVHQDDRPIIRHSIGQSLKGGEFLVYCRYISAAGVFVVLEVRGNPHFSLSIEEPEPKVDYIVMSGREYKSKATASLDSIIEMRIENIRLRKMLSQLDPSFSLQHRFGSFDFNTQSPLEPQFPIAPLVEAPVRKRKDEDLFCKQCGSTESPEWRRGPLGAKT